MMGSDTITFEPCWRILLNHNGGSLYRTRCQTSSSSSLSYPATSTSTTGTSHLVKCAEKEKTFCVNGGECFMVKDLTNPSRYLCK